MESKTKLIKIMEKHHAVLDAKNSVESTQEEIDAAETLLTFRNQKLMNLWKNEFEGQISDGMWENSSRTDWLWRSNAIKLAEVTTVQTHRASYDRIKTDFPMSSKLWAIIGDRIMAENGFTSEKEAKAAWQEIRIAIKKYYKRSEESRKKYNELKEKRTLEKLTRENLIIDVKTNNLTVLGFEPDSRFGRQYLTYKHNGIKAEANLGASNADDCVNLQLSGENNDLLLNMWSVPIKDVERIIDEYNRFYYSIKGL